MGFILNVIFKDKCDLCGKFEILNGKYGKCFCKDCINQHVKNKKINVNAKNHKKLNEKQMTIYDFGCDS